MLFVLNLMEDDGEEHLFERDDVAIDRCIAELAKGNISAMTELYNLTKSAIYGFSLSLVKNAQDAEDILQETYIKIFTSAPNYVTQKKPMAWIFTITRNLSLMKIRAKSKIIDITDDILESNYMDVSQVSNEDKFILKAIIRELSDEEAQIVMLYAVAGYKHKEIAELLDIPLSTILSKYRRALAKLRTKLETL